MSGITVLPHDGPSPAGGEPGKTRPSAQAHLAVTRQKDTKDRVGNGAGYTSDLKPPVAEIGEAARGASLLAQKNRKYSEPVVAMIVGILALAGLNIAIYGTESLNFFIYGTIGIGLTFEYGWISVILRAAVAGGDHDYEDAHE
ncbi:MAG: hypothetical protein M1492_11810 [Gammaproteobacteria bacterium]|nr:hypothetical protein [Gammaproteobacteria bacterium]